MYPKLTECSLKLTECSLKLTECSLKLGQYLCQHLGQYLCQRLVQLLLVDKSKEGPFSQISPTIRMADSENIRNMRLDSFWSHLPRILHSCMICSRVGVQHIKSSRKHCGLWESTPIWTVSKLFSCFLRRRSSSCVCRILLVASNEYFRCPPSYWSHLTNILNIHHPNNRF